MTPLEAILLMVAGLLVLVTLAALFKLSDARHAAEDAADAAATAIQAAERSVLDATRTAAAAERHARVAEAGWNRAVDALQRAQRPAPVTYSGDPAANAPKRLQAVRRG